jgi:hypothetical protein
MSDITGEHSAAPHKWRLQVKQPPAQQYLQAALTLDFSLILAWSGRRGLRSTWDTARLAEIATLTSAKAGVSAIGLVVGAHIGCVNCPQT